jgi:hypothetical protein
VRDQKELDLQEKLERQEFGKDIGSLERSLARQPNETLIDYWIRYIPIYLKLREFYSSMKMKRKLWDFKKAQRAEFDRGVDAILRMVDVENRSRGDDRKVVFALGNADFQSKKSVHVSFENYFIAKVRSLGYKVVFVDEYYTSQKAPCCGNQTEFFGFRVKYCRNCHKFFHRDVMAGENTVNVARSILVGGSS